MRLVFWVTSLENNQLNTGLPQGVLTDLVLSLPPQTVILTQPKKKHRERTIMDRDHSNYTHSFSINASIVRWADKPYRYRNTREKTSFVTD